MTIETEIPSVSFSGSKKVQETASRAFEVMRLRGMFVADNAPIRVKKDELVAFLAGSAALSETDVDKALTQNPGVFLIEVNDDGDEVVITTRVARAPSADATDGDHTFFSRLMTPQPKPATPPAPVRERVRVDPSWATFTVPELPEEEDDEAQIVEPGVVEHATVPEPVTEEETVPEEPEVIAAEIEAPEIPAPAPVETRVEPQQEPGVPIDVARRPAATAEFAAAEVARPEPEVTEEPIVKAPIIEIPAPAAPVTPVVRTAPARILRTTDVSAFDDDAIAAAITERLAGDTRVGRFGNQWMTEDRVHRLSRGELRRIKEYIDEQEQPLTDDTLVQDVLGVRPNNPSYQLSLFSVNYRLSREREFEFVGTNDQRFWATTTLPSIGTDRRKHNDIGTDLRLLTESMDGGLEHRSVEAVDHVVTFYEHTLGLLPYDDDMRKLLPAPVIPEQRSAVFTFEIPQTYTTYLVELRYPTPNRGGYLLGLDDFYADSVVPGAVISITATENDGHYKVEYLETDDQEDRLLELDDRRAPRYHFRSTTYSCVVDDRWLINEARFPNLGSEKPLPDKIRRRNDAVLKATFERIGMADGNGGLWASFDDLLAAVNIERPFTEGALRAALEAESTVSGDDANGYTYASRS